jgi:hypothetical protein
MQLQGAAVSETENVKVPFPNYKDPQDWITIGLSALIAVNTFDIIKELTGT